MSKILVIATGWHYSSHFYENMIKQVVPEGWGVDYFCVAHRLPENENTIKEKELRSKLKSESKDWEIIIEFIGQTITIKEKIVIQLNKIKQLKTFVKTDSGFKVVGQEGFTAISDGKIVKLVDRLEFTKNLFNTTKNWDK